MTNQNLSELESKILNCVDYSPHFIAVKPNQALELIAYILASQTQPTPSQSEEREALDRWIADNYFSIEHANGDCDCVITTDDIRAFWQARTRLYKPQPERQGEVKIPTSIDEAKAMAIISTNYLKQYAPNELHPQKDSANLSKPHPTSQDVLDAETKKLLSSIKQAMIASAISECRTDWAYMIEAIDAAMKESK